ncbi:MAG: bifunctional riboflavin kinase/FAD synthetase [Chloroflexi bacterium]|nr:bifunctional riboflavin kinase/FAD synthetase [Chloroflexota bacterium]
MSIHQELPPQSPKRDTVLTIGVFDGVHLGHQHLLKHLKDTASREGLLSGVLTFVNHPRTVLHPGSCVSYITSVEDRLALLKEQGVDMVIPLTFDLELSRLRAREFVALLRDRLRMAGLVMGFNFALGYRREGDPETLKALGKEMGFSVAVVDAVSMNGDRVSSTAIRDEVSAGDVAKASRSLGRPFALQGSVVRGKTRGRTLGFPTANLEIAGHRLIPGNGIYATWAYIGRDRYMAATSIGVRPTFGEGERTVEVFILDYQGELYGTELRVEFAQRLRDEMRFETPEALVTQMHRDVEQTREVLKRATPGSP